MSTDRVIVAVPPGDGDRALVVSGRRMLTTDVCELEFRDPAGGALGAATAGAHINVTTPSGLVRSYSLTGDLADDSVRRIAVRRSADGRGGSRSIVDDVAVGDTVRVSEPRNTFALEPAAGYLLIAAGIGITPIRAMLLELLRGGHEQVELVYLSRSAAETPYLDEVMALASRLPVTVHHRADAGDLDLWRLLETPGERRLYCCGPERLQDEVRGLTMHWRPSRVHFEDFAGVDAFGDLSLPFSVTWQPTGAEIPVRADQTMLEALRGGGAEIASSCESGTCGTCRIRLLAGEPDHRDATLTEAERAGLVMPCVSRSLSESLTVGPR